MAVSLPLAAATAAPAQAAPAVAFTSRAGGLSQPTQVTSARDGRARMFVVEKTGLVRIFAGGKMLPRPFLDLRSRVRTDGEGGQACRQGCAGQQVAAGGFQPCELHHRAILASRAGNGLQEAVALYL